ncbi:T9SS type A sorting domain-containing protein [Psychroserpens ponticola]|uniref:T9SS type A sorting domain-containing protein n=1 Tax=Psychroserpens ponticola TaxID=2932268 RepID=A0ABY7RYC1_9FLAO|nr:T9SS type A sorting domain-containing protein [Psychroserpens ponticola]WCO01686.1 T9SS type A sorting domain-containing protein [Psychroserpens ponticola]
MKKITLLFIVIPFLCFCQVQIGNDINGTNITDRFGISVSISLDGSIVAIGSDFSDENGFNSGSVKVYTNINSNWEQLGNTISGEAEFDGSGIVTTLSSDGTTVAISAFGNDGNGDRAGHVRIFKFQNNSWIQLGSDIDGENELDFFGRSTSLSSNGNIVAISSADNDTNGENTGHVKIFQYQGNNWTQLGNTINGTADYQRFGESISLSSDGTILAVGATGNSNKTSIYEFENNNWIQLGNDIVNETLFDQSGQCVSLSSNGQIIAVGAPLNNDNGNDSGYVRVFEYLNNEWQQLGDDINGEASNDYSGWSLSLSSDGTTVAIGAHLNDGSEPDAGHVRVYNFENNSWTQVGIDIDGEASEDNFGTSVSLSGDGTTLAVGALNNDANGTDSGHVRIFDLSDPLSIDEFQNSMFQLYPNPTKNQFTIQLNNTSILKEINIYNTLGQVVLTSENTVIDTSTLASGSYIVEIQTTEGKASKKLIID